MPENYVTYAYCKDLTFDLNSSRQFFKIWHLGKYIRDGSNVLDLGSGWGDVGKFIIDNNIKANYYPVDIENRNIQYPANTVFTRVDFSCESILGKVPEVKYDVICMLDVLQNVSHDIASKLLKDVFQMADNAIVCVSLQLDNYVAKSDDGLFLKAWQLRDFNGLIDRIGFHKGPTFGLNYGRDKNSVSKIDDLYRSDDLLYHRLRNFLPDELARTLLGICFTDSKFIMVDLYK